MTFWKRHRWMWKVHRMLLRVTNAKAVELLPISPYIHLYASLTHSLHSLHSLSHVLVVCVFGVSRIHHFLFHLSRVIERYLKRPFIPCTWNVIGGPWNFACNRLRHLRKRRLSIHKNGHSLQMNQHKYENFYQPHGRHLFSKDSCINFHRHDETHSHPHLFVPCRICMHVQYEPHTPVLDII